MKKIIIALLLLSLSIPANAALFGYFKDDVGDIVGKFVQLTDKKIDNPGCTRYYCTEEEFENIVVVNKKKKYNASRFLQSVYTDETLIPILSANEGLKVDLGFCLQNGNFTLAAIIITQAVINGDITQEDADYFATKLYNEEGVTL